MRQKEKKREKRKQKGRQGRILSKLGTVLGFFLRKTRREDWKMPSEREMERKDKGKKGKMQNEK